MQANEWGPSAWKFLHTVTFAYPQDPDEETKKHYKDLFSTLRYTLPCSFCRNYYTEMYKHIIIDPYLDSREGLTFWLFIIHNLVNRKLERSLANFEDIVLEYENNRARCGSMNNIEQYTKCKTALKPLEHKDFEKSINLTFSKYKKIAYDQIEKFYKTAEIIDPHFKKCNL
jgi:hypothetical protein